MEFKKLTVNGVSYGDVKEGDENYSISSFEDNTVTNVDFKDK